MKQLTIFALALFMNITAFAHSGHGNGDGHLKFSGGNLHAHLSWIKGPNGNTGPSTMKLEWHDGSTHSVIEPGLPFSVVLWMPSMGHGSSPTKIQPFVDSQGSAVKGTYQVSHMHFLMPGDWEVKVTVKYSNGKEETQAWALIVSGGDGGHGGH